MRAYKRRFYITEANTSEKVVKSARLEEIRITILNALVDTFPVGGRGARRARTTRARCR